MQFFFFYLSNMFLESSVMRETLKKSRWSNTPDIKYVLRGQPLNNAGSNNGECFSASNFNVHMTCLQPIFLPKYYILPSDWLGIFNEKKVWVGLHLIF